MASRPAVFDAGGMRKIYGESDRADLVAAVKRGAPVAEAARHHGVTVTTAYRWMRLACASSDHNSAVKTPTFLELVTSADIGAGLVVRVGAAEIEVRAGFDRELLRAVVATLGGAA